MVRPSRATIQRSGKGRVEMSTAVESAVAPSTRLSANRVAFQSLLAKLRPRSNFDDVLRANGISSVICGPGSIFQAHKPDEYVEIAQLQACLDLLGRLARRLSV